MGQFGSEPVRDPGHLGFDKARLARLKRWMQRYGDTGRWPGGAVLVARHGELAFFDCAGHADVEAKRPWQRNLIAGIYSMTRPVTAVALMMLYEEARVHLDDPVEAYLPEFKNRQLLIPDAKSLDQTVPVKTKMTIRHLLTHTSGSPPDRPRTAGRQSSGSALERPCLHGRGIGSARFPMRDRRRSCGRPTAICPWTRTRHTSLATPPVSRSMRTASSPQFPSVSHPIGDTLGGPIITKEIAEGLAIVPTKADVA